MVGLLVCTTCLGFFAWFRYHGRAVLLRRRLRFGRLSGILTDGHKAANQLVSSSSAFTFMHGNGDTNGTSISKEMTSPAVSFINVNHPQSSSKSIGSTMAHVIGQFGGGRGNGKRSDDCLDLLSNEENADDERPTTSGKTIPLTLALAKATPGVLFHENLSHFTLDELSLGYMHGMSLGWLARWSHLSPTGNLTRVTGT